LQQNRSRSTRLPEVGIIQVHTAASRKDGSISLDLARVIEPACHGTSDLFHLSVSRIERCAPPIVGNTLLDVGIDATYCSNWTTQSRT
jgi:hypothetical protein